MNNIDDTLLSQVYVTNLTVETDEGPITRRECTLARVIIHSKDGTKNLIIRKTPNYFGKNKEIGFEVEFEHVSNEELETLFVKASDLVKDFKPVNLTTEDSSARLIAFNDQFDTGIFQTDNLGENDIKNVMMQYILPSEKKYFTKESNVEINTDFKQTILDMIEYSQIFSDYKVMNSLVEYINITNGTLLVLEETLNLNNDTTIAELKKQLETINKTEQPFALDEFRILADDVLNGYYVESYVERYNKENPNDEITYETIEDLKTRNWSTKQLKTILIYDINDAIKSFKELNSAVQKDASEYFEMKEYLTTLQGEMYAALAGLQHFYGVTSKPTEYILQQYSEEELKEFEMAKELDSGKSLTKSKT